MLSGRSRRSLDQNAVRHERLSPVLAAVLTKRSEEKGLFLTEVLNG